MRNSQVARLLTLISVLDRTPGGLTVPEMRRALEARGIHVTVRTLYRDIAALDQAGLPLFLAEHGDEHTSVQRWKFTHHLKVVKAYEVPTRLAS